ncbi:MAG: GNAT family N-acetyltransferase [Chitinophagaceae bacterium]|nr:GNAT family N-acetyltransferase [Chitinophagaceae bacterium]MCW5904235.1 GNAT family N-acetyltransferase [Chitinophagaceae bacterium]
MNKTSDVTIRPIQVTDIEKLKFFFIKAYGQQTIFQNEDFLTHYFSTRLNNKPPFSNSLIGINKKEEIVSHYGGLEYSLKINHTVKPIIWGVNAYTLSEYRGKGVNSQIVNHIINNNIINGIIGLSSQMLSFYQKLGYNIFNAERFSRHILVLNHTKTVEVCNYIQQDSKHIIEQNKLLKDHLYPYKIIELTAKNIHHYHVNLDEDFTEITTTYRTKEFLIWRFFKNPFIQYTLYGIIDEDTIVAYIALREETLSPFDYKVNRIIDLFGRIDVVKILLHKTIIKSILNNHIYIDFSKFGSVYEKELQEFNFIPLENEDCCILPQVTSPVENRPNNEYIGMFSKTFCEEIKNLSKANVYFTRIDADRDRLAKITQLK